MKQNAFALQVKEWADKVAKRSDIALQDLMLSLARKVDERSPVGQPALWKNPAPKGYVGGHFRANWQFSIGGPAVGEIPGADPSGAKTLGRIQAEIKAARMGQVLYLVNNVPYAIPLEYGYSRQQPAGIVGRTAIEFNSILRDSVERAKAATP